MVIKIRIYFSVLNNNSHTDLNVAPVNRAVDNSKRPWYVKISKHIYETQIYQISSLEQRMLKC